MYIEFKNARHDSYKYVGEPLIVIQMNRTTDFNFGNLPFFRYTKCVVGLIFVNIFTNS